MFLAGSSLKVDTCYIRRKFYAACNGILSYSRSADEFVKLFLVKAFCLPLLTYCLGALDISATCIRQLAVCWNDSFRKIFGFKRCESVKLLQYYCSELPLEYIYDLQKWKFLSNTSVVSDRFVALYHFKQCTLDNICLKNMVSTVVLLAWSVLLWIALLLLFYAICRL